MLSRPSRGQPARAETVAGTVSAAEPQSKPAEPRYDLSNITLPAEGQAAIGVVDDTTYNTPNEHPAPIASVTKIITALAVMKKTPFQPGESGGTITITQQDEKYYHKYFALNGTLTGITAGQQISQYEMLQAILLASSNNLADTLVDHYFGSTNEYLAYANTMLREDFGLNNTHVADASGFSPESVSTPSDMLVIGRKALENPVIADIVDQVSANTSFAGELPNYNLLITEPEVNGIKPGFTEQAGYCLLFSAELPNKDGQKVTFIGMVMGQQYRPTYYDTVHRFLDEARTTIGKQ